MRKLDFTDSVVILLILLLPLLFYVPLLFSTNYLTSDVRGFKFDLQTVLWILTIKIYLMFFLFLWYFTCKHWWKLAILIPIVIELFKLLTFFNENIHSFDEVDFITSIPVTFPLLLIILFLTKKVMNYSSARQINEKLNYEIDVVFQSLSRDSNQKDIKLMDEYHDLKHKKSEYNKADYLEKLIALRNKMY